MMSRFGWKTLGIALVAVVLVTGAALAYGSGRSYYNSGYMNSGVSYDRSARHVTPCSLAEERTTKVHRVRNCYTHATNCAVEQRYSKADRDCLFDQLRKDHRVIGDLMARLASCSVADRTAAWGQFRTLLLSHMQGEERTLYPALEQTDAARLVGLRAEEEHAAAAAVFQKLDAGDMTSDRWVARFGVLREMIRHHVDEEQSKVFSAARRDLSIDQIRSLCAAFVEQKQAALARLPPMVVVTSVQVPAATSNNAPSTPPMNDQPMGFDDLSSQNMIMHCPSCGAAVGTFCPYNEASIEYPNDQSSMSQPSTSNASAQSSSSQSNISPTGTPNQPVTETGMSNAADQPMGMPGELHCPSCGAAMGGVCPYYTPTGMSSSPGMNGTSNSPTTNSDSNSGKAKY